MAGNDSLQEILASAGALKGSLGFGLGFRVEGSGFRVEGLGFRV